MDIFILYYTNELTPTQKMLIINRMISTFGPACKPTSLTVADNLAKFTFDTPCMTTDEIIRLGDKVMSDNHESNTVAKVVKNGAQVWPAP